MYFLFLTIMFQHTAARRRLQGGSMRSSDLIKVSTHSRAEAAALKNAHKILHNAQFQHTAARRRLQNCTKWQKPTIQFQHTAARRRLRPRDSHSVLICLVSTHSRAEAAALIRMYSLSAILFQHTAARRRLR